MPDQNKNSRHYNAADFERYYSGNMNKQDMYELEKAAMEDSFLADALEGYAYTHTPSADIREIEMRLSRKKKNSKILWLQKSNASTLLRVAAILILVTGFSWLIFNKRKTSSNSTVIIVNKQPPINPQLKGDGPAASSDSFSAIVKTVPGTTSSYNVIDSTELARNDMNDHLFNIPVKDINKDKYFSGAVQNIAIDKSAPAEKEEKVISGRILDNSGNAVPLATVTENGKKEIAVTDNAGQFKFAVKDSAAQLIVHAPGSDSETSRALDSSGYDIAMQEKQNPLEEVVVTSTIPGKRKNVTSSASIDVHPRVTVKYASPVSGWEQYNKFIADSLRNKQQLKAHSLKNQVILTFKVNGNREPVHIKVKSSVCGVCDMEAIRIIQHEKWIMTGKSSRAEAVVQF